MVNPEFDRLPVNQRRLNYALCVVDDTLVEVLRAIVICAERVDQKISDNTHTSSKYFNVSRNTLLSSKPPFMWWFLRWFAECAKSLSQPRKPSRSVNYGPYKLEGNPMGGISRFSSDFA
jgi:hypothetical protein